ncbi:MAG: hypothetical protein HYV60_23795, partial [Planctomycetia bacterium]|nr:hypothetical protein [Planctomycetia bacterium]
IDFKRDNEGQAGTLCFSPEADAGTYDEDFFEFDHLTAALPGLRQTLIRGDLPPLYLAWLACVGDEDAMEPPVPAGLSQLTRELDTLCEFYELSPDLVAAAAESSPAAPPAQDEQRWLQKWIDDRPVEQLRELVRRMLSDGEQTLRAETLAHIRQATASGAWPTCEPARTLAELRATAKGHQDRREQSETSAREKARQERLAAIAADPNQTIDHVRLLVKMRSTSDYEQAARELAELREALGPTHGEKQAREVAAQLVRDNPTLRRLKSALRGQGLLSKS